jgi:lysophospholipase L1-like esterase
MATADAQGFRKQAARMLNAVRSLVFWLLLPFVAVQASRLRRTAPRLQAAAGEARGRTGSGSSLRLLAIGDSIIAGVGATTLDRALVGRTAESLAALHCRTVEWEAHGISGANAHQILAELVPALDPVPADAIIVSVGVNDVTSLSTIRAWKRNLFALVSALRAHSPDAVIVIAGIPPLRAFPLIPEPLRSLIGFRGETLDRVMREVLREQAGVLHAPVVFEIRSDSFCTDGFHPSEQSYVEFGQAMAARIVAQLAG